ncbi:TELO2-interacting protein 1-like protein [Nibea albiflora]|uniref:TELO2-interacting protein 1-like protein n=1 Tax=Nibea albiflora TaxID=240163 RepID=A0ACB7EKY3_NIBAL|nr:TELO2-interacting protein 1-like protein [Nibea albiflora]
MLTHSDCSLLPLVGDIVQDVLMALDLSYDHTAALFCSVLHALMKALARWFPPSCRRTSESARPKQTSTQKEVFDVRQFLLDQRKQKELAEGIGIEEDDNEDLEVPPPTECEDVEDLGGPDVKAELPPHLSITKDVMERCIHLLSDPSLRLRLKVLCTLGDTCGDFLRRRVSKEILPKLSSSLTRQAPISAKAGPVYTHTLAYKLQLAVLQAEADLDAVCEACLPYLSCRQPIRLQEASQSVFRHLIQVDPDAFWFTLSELHCPSSYIPPHPDLHPVQLSGMGRPRDEYSDNVLKLLREEFGSVAEPVG